MQVSWQEQQKNDILSALDAKAISIQERDQLLREVLERCEMEEIVDATTHEIEEIIGGE